VFFALFRLHENARGFKATPRHKQEMQQLLITASIYEVPGKSTYRRQIYFKSDQHPCLVDQ
jgi:hypothetical protein